MKLDEKDQKAWQDVRNGALLSEDPEKDFETDEFCEQIGHVLGDIYKYIFHAYNMDDNPLRHLRKYFPRFKWEYHQPADMRELFRIVTTSDYVWLERGPSSSWQDCIITAQQKGRKKPRVLCYCDDDANDWPTELKTIGGARFVIVQGGDTVVE